MTNDKMKFTKIKSLQKDGLYWVGVIPFWLDVNDPDPAAKQIDAHYQHGGGWDPFPGYKHLGDGVLKYPGDPKMKPMAEMDFRNEKLYFYEGSWVMVLQEDGSFEVSRID